MKDGQSSYFRGLLDITGHQWTPEMPSHGGNTGSNPVGDANCDKGLTERYPKLLTDISQRRGWTSTDLSRFCPVCGPLTPPPARSTSTGRPYG